MLPRKDHFKYKYTNGVKVIGCKKNDIKIATIRRLEGHIKICPNRLQDKDHCQR